ncbi:MAG: response regulator transcription factor [Phycisphaerales bacterium]|nr:MAG: response regulator transcription factor [Phycisphaerales bacterium]
MKCVLIVEDSEAMLRGLKDNFETKGYRVKIARDGEQGLNAALSEKPDLIILDIMLPKMNGFEICSQVRKKKLDMPIIMLTAKDQESDIVLGLNLGADDYVTKPFSIKELLARADAFMRRRGAEEPDAYEFGDCRLDTVAGTFTRDGQETRLSPGEFKMLQLFLRRAGCTLTCDEIRGAVWGYSHFVTLRDIEQAVNTLRDKIEPDPKNPIFIRTVVEIGYKFEHPQPYGNDSDS